MTAAVWLPPAVAVMLAANAARLAAASAAAAAASSAEEHVTPGQSPNELLPPLLLPHGSSPFHLSNKGRPEPTVEARVWRMETCSGSVAASAGLGEWERSNKNGSSSSLVILAARLSKRRLRFSLSYHTCWRWLREAREQGAALLGHGEAYASLERSLSELCFQRNGDIFEERQLGVLLNQLGRRGKSASSATIQAAITVAY